MVNQPAMEILQQPSIPRTTSEKKGTRTRNDRRSRVRRLRILEAARELFQEKGFTATTLDQIVARIGGSKGTIYLYFNDKSDLFETIVRNEAENFYEAVISSLEPRDGQEGSIAHVIEQLISAATMPHTIGLLRTVIAEFHQHPSVASIYRKIILRIRIEVRKALRNVLHSNRAAGAEAVAAIDALLSMLVADAQMSVLTGLFDPLSQERRTQRLAQRIRALALGLRFA